MNEISVWSYFWLSFGFGFISLLTPCVFPLIPITVSYFLKRQDSVQTKKLLDSLLYALSIIITFSLLGLVITIFFGASGLNKLASLPILNLMIGILFLLFALNLMGFFEVRIPTFILNLLGHTNFTGIFPTLFMGFTFTLTTFTCTMPFLGTVLISAASGEWFFPLVGMFGYGLAFAFPFFFLSLFPSFLQTLPKSGSWMVSFKIVMGFLEILASLKFFSNVDIVWNFGILSKDVFIFLSSLILFLIALYLFGVYKFPHETNLKKISKLRTTWALTFLSMAFYLILALVFHFPFGELNAYLPPSGYGKLTYFSSQKEFYWIRNLEQAKEESKRTGKPIFIDFTGFTCVNCRWMEENIFSNPEVQSSLSRFILVQLYTDGEGEEYEKNQAYQEKKFGTIGLPLYVIMDAKENLVVKLEGMTRDIDEFLKFLQLGFSSVNL